MDTRCCQDAVVKRRISSPAKNWNFLSSGRPAVGLVTVEIGGANSFVYYLEGRTDDVTRTMLPSSPLTILHHTELCLCLNF
jgi:hypothetical protein